MDFKGALELLAERYGVELQREEEDPKEAERRKRRERLLELLSRTTAYYERYLWESEEAAKAREYLLGRGLGEEILREFRVGYAPSAWDRVLSASRRGGFSEQRAVSTRASRSARRRMGGRRALVRPLPLADHVPAGGRARARAGLRRARDGRGTAAEVPEHVRQRHLPQGPAAVRRGSGACARDEGGRGDRVRGLHRRDRAAPGGDPQRGGADGHGADGRAGGRAGADGADGAARAGRGQRGAGGDAEGVSPRQQTQAGAARGDAAGGHRPGGADPARRRGGDAGRRSSARSRS